MMKNRQLHTIILPLCTLLLFSCTQDTISPAPDSENEIRFQTGTTTRGLIDNLADEDTKICLYGFRGNAYLAAGKEKQLSGKTLAYKDGRWAVVDGSGNPLTYFWEGENVQYRFFSWLQQAPDGLTAPFIPTYDEANKKLTIPETVVNKDYNQFDFMYSDVDERTLDANNKSIPVEMGMHHLFTAFGIGISNTSEDDIYIKSVTLRTLHDKGSAVIDFSKTPCEVTYGTTSISRNPQTEAFISFTGNQKVDKENGVLYNIFNPTATAKEYYMVWPQAESVFPKLEFANDDAEAAAPDTDFPIILVYESDGQSFKKRMQLPQQAWVAGKLNYFDILVADKLVEITATVTDWKYAHADVDFNESTISVKEDNHLIWDGNTCIVNDAAKKVYVKNGQPVEGTFTIDTPAGGKWRVSLEGDVTAFTIMDDAAPTDDGFGPIDGKQHRIRVVPLISNPDRDYSVTLKFVAVTADSKTYPADDMVQDCNGDKKADKYTIVLESAN